VLYKHKKGGGVYALQPDNTLLFYNGQAQPTKGNIKDQVDLSNYNQQNQNDLSLLAAQGVWSMSRSEEGRKAYKQLTGNELPSKLDKKEEYVTYADDLESKLKDKDWDTVVKTIGHDLGGKPNAKTTYDFLGNIKRLPELRETVRQKIYGAPTPPKMFGKLTQEEFNEANEEVLDVYSPQSTLSPKQAFGIKMWISDKITSGPYTPGQGSPNKSEGTYDDFKRLSKEDQQILLEIINESKKTDNAK
jgi:hypothetical protein